MQIRKNNPNYDFVWVTIISGEWETSDEITKIDLNSVSGATRRTLSAIAPDYLSTIETCAFSNARADQGGKLLSPHMHSILWGKDAFAKASEIEAGHADRYVVPFTGASTIVVKKIGLKKADFARLASYCFKAPHKCKNYYQSRDGETRNLHEGTKTDRYIRYLRLAQIYSMQTIDNVIFAGGDGAKVRSAMLKGVKGRIALEKVCGNELIHRDAIPNYWAELLPRLNQSRFQLPFIRTRK